MTFTEQDTSKQSWNQSGSKPDKTRRKVHPAGRNQIFVVFFSDFFQVDVRNESYGFCRITAGFLLDFLSYFQQFDVKKEPAGFRPDQTNFESGRTGPDGKNSSGSNSASKTGSGYEKSLFFTFLI